MSIRFGPDYKKPKNADAVSDSSDSEDKEEELLANYGSVNSNLANYGSVNSNR